MSASATGVPPARFPDHPFVQGLDAAFLEAIAPAARWEAHDTGALLTREGSPAGEFFLLVSGKVAVELAAPGQPHRTLQTLGPGDLLGWSWLLPPGRWRFDARAVRPTAAWRVEAAPVRAALEARPADGYRFLLRMLPVLASRLEHARIQLGDLYAP